MDQSFLVLINQRWTSPALDRLMAMVSSFALWLPVLIVLVAMVLWRGRKRARWFLVCLGVTLIINDMLIGNALKHLAHRLRPFQAEPGVRQVDLDHHAHAHFLAFIGALDLKTSTVESVAAVPAGSGRSFPSNHTTNNFCAATLLTIFYRRRGALYFLVAALVGYSRIYLGAHWPSDVLASAFLAVGWVLGAAALVRWRLGNHSP